MFGQTIVQNHNEINRLKMTTFLQVLNINSSLNWHLNVFLFFY